MTNIAIIMGKVSEVQPPKALKDDERKKIINFDVMTSDGGRVPCSYIGEDIESIVEGVIILAECRLKNVVYTNAQGDQRKFISYVLRSFDVIGDTTSPNVEKVKEIFK